MDQLHIPSNIFRSLIFPNGQCFTKGEPFPGGKADAPKIGCILFVPAKTTNVRIAEDEEESVTTPARYLIFMVEPDGSWGPEVRIYEIHAGPGVLALRDASRKAVLDEIKEILAYGLEDVEAREATKDEDPVPDELVKAVTTVNLARSNGQQAPASP